MTYTFWHSGILIGESDLEERSDHPRQRGGIFRPTVYGLEVFPRLTGILSAGHALKTHLEANGLSPDEMDEHEIDELLDGTPAGQKIIDIGRMLSEVEMRAPDGRRLEFASIAFSDSMELKLVARELEGGAVDELADLPSDALHRLRDVVRRRAFRQSRAGRRSFPAPASGERELTGLANDSAVTKWQLQRFVG
jgi:hypothetical protein